MKVPSEDIIEACGFWSVPIFARRYFPEYIEKAFAGHHRSILESVPRGERGKKVNIVAARGSGKSGLMVIYALHCVYYKEAYELLNMQPDRYIFVVSQSTSFAVQRSEAMIYKINEHPAFQHLQGSWWWGKTAGRTSNGVMIQPQGRGGQVRGALSVTADRPSLIISDDLDDDESVRNPEQRQKNQEWYDKALLRIGSLDGSSNFWNIDTNKHPESITMTLANRSGWETQVHKAIKHPELLTHPTAEHLWQEWQGLYNDMMKPDRERLAEAQAFYEQNEDEMVAGVEHLWEEMIPYLEVRKEVADLGYHSVLQELQCDSTSGGQQIFDMENAIRFSVTADGLLRTDDRLVKWGEIAGATVFLDWAGGTDNQRNAYACAVCIIWVKMAGDSQRWDADTLSGTNGYVYKVWLDRKPLTEQISESLNLLVDVKQSILARNKKRPEVKFAVEDFIGWTASEIRKSLLRAFNLERQERGLDDLTLQFLTRTRNKLERINALEPSINNGWLAFNSDLPADFIKMFEQYPTADYLDGPDATEGACNFRTTSNSTARERSRQNYKERAKDYRVSV